MEQVIHRMYLSRTISFLKTTAKEDKMENTKPCPMCNPQGWLDENGNPMEPVRSRYHCEFCGSTGKLLVLEQEDIDELEGEEKNGRDMGC